MYYEAIVFPLSYALLRGKSNQSLVFLLLTLWVMWIMLQQIILREVLFEYSLLECAIIMCKTQSYTNATNLQPCGRHFF